MLSKKVGRDLCKDITKIENYEIALNDKTASYVCHHRLEIREVLGRVVYISSRELMGLGLYYNRPPEELIFLERKYHRHLHNASKEFRNKQSLAKKGWKNPRKGCHLTEEQKRNMSEGHLRNMNDITKEKIRKAYYLRQDVLLRQLRKPIKQIDIQTNKVIRIFDSIQAANDYFGLPKKNSNIGACCKGHRKTAYGFIWEYVIKDDRNRI